MSNRSAIEFPTPTRIHIALAVRDVSRAVDFYRGLLGQEPTKERPGYAKFEVFDPPLNLSLNETAQATAPPMPQHYGIQVKHPAAIGEIAGRLANGGFEGEAEEQVTCCYAVQDKVWVTDPDGHRWELFLVTEADTAVHSRGRVGPSADAEAPASEQPCCAPTCCT
jgi:catechol 2,3-dioxygenase-like lactoylglutathione lyase family enzyme